MAPYRSGAGLRDQQPQVSHDAVLVPYEIQIVS